MNFLTVRLSVAFPEPAWGSDLPDWLPPLCVSPWQDPTAFPVPTFQDLAGFWDLLQLSIEDVTLKFLELQQLKANSWKLLEPKVCLWVLSGQEATLWNALLRKECVNVWIWGSRGRGEDSSKNSFR